MGGVVNQPSDQLILLINPFLCDNNNISIGRQYSMLTMLQSWNQVKSFDPEVVVWPDLEVVT